MTLPDEVEKVVNQEETVLTTVVDSLRSQRSVTGQRLANESRRSQTLTAELVGARRAEDKAQLASDEAVSYALTEKGMGDVKTLDRLIEKPYFARLVVEEEQRVGPPKALEYRLGVAANTDCRIIDWRKAPISRLYYEYKEGDSYEEEILGRERIGTVSLRRQIDIDKSRIKRISYSGGTVVRANEGWRVTGRGKRSAGEGYGQLRDVLPLITPEQFKMITEDATTAVLIQGIAGSGKTTVALHRLAWLLHPDNSSLKADEVAVIALSRSLKSFIERSVGALSITGVKVLTFEEWAALSVAELVPACVARGSDGQLEISRPVDRTGAAIERVKRSMGVLRALERRMAGANAAAKSAAELLIETLSDFAGVIELDDSKLLNRELISAARERTVRNLESNLLDKADDALLLRIYQLRNEETKLHTGKTGLYGHLVVDEIQEFSPSELACVVSAVEDPTNLTLVGDVAQRTATENSFPGWEKLRSTWNLGESMSRFMSLTVSHRSTIEIMRLADFIQKRTVVTDGRHGRVPIWFQSRHERNGIKAALNWLTTAMERYASAITAVICRDNAEARHVLSLLEPTFGSAVRLGDERAFSFQEGIVVTDVSQVKGVEFTNVLLWNPTVKSYPVGEESRNALYVAVTRAEENLALVTWGQPASGLPPIRSQLVRGFELDIQEDEEAADQAKQEREERKIGGLR
jgi:DNA helicase-2/ATP-dependent DNA helicase PcrA